MCIFLIMALRRKRPVISEFRPDWSTKCFPGYPNPGSEGTIKNQKTMKMKKKMHLIKRGMLQLQEEAELGNSGHMVLALESSI